MSVEELPPNLGVASHCHKPHIDADSKSDIIFVASKRTASGGRGLPQGGGSGESADDGRQICRHLVTPQRIEQLRREAACRQRRIVFHSDGMTMHPSPVCVGSNPPGLFHHTAEYAR